MSADDGFCATCGLKGAHDDRFHVLADRVAKLEAAAKRQAGILAELLRDAAKLETDVAVSRRQLTDPTCPDCVGEQIVLANFVPMPANVREAVCESQARCATWRRNFEDAEKRLADERATANQALADLHDARKTLHLHQEAHSETKKRLAEAERQLQCVTDYHANAVVQLSEALEAESAMAECQAIAVEAERARCLTWVLWVSTKDEWFQRRLPNAIRNGTPAPTGGDGAK